MRAKKTCEHDGTWTSARVLSTYTVGELTFSAVLAGERCDLCGTEVVPLAEMARLEEAAARSIAQEGPPSADAFRFLRKHSRITATELAELLDTDKPTVSRWENGKYAFNRGTWAALSAIALDAIAGRTDTIDRLRGLTKPRPSLAKTIPVTLPARAAAK